MIKVREMEKKKRRKKLQIGGKKAKEQRRGTQKAGGGGGTAHTVFGWARRDEAGKVSGVRQSGDGCRGLGRDRAWTCAHVNPRPSLRAAAFPAHLSGRRASLIDVIGRYRRGRAATPFTVRPLQRQITPRARGREREDQAPRLPELMPGPGII